ncbi:hypothetical protein L1049_021980 [Liquidambar formosana]|uniref:3-beta hydroxysteroid dehydrogenase/isomerase domain-containing protein n=1 Tax=Liquidambar formosana TaxID=63359 RepID=A0AAP0RBR8_LIQFO
MKARLWQMGWDTSKVTLATTGSDGVSPRKGPKDDTSKVGLLKSLPGADTRLVLFQADIYNPNEFEAAIEGCQFVFHVATPLPHSLHDQSSQYEDMVEAVVAAVRSIADSCIRSQTVKRLIYTASVTASSPLKEDGTGFKSCMDESCWTPLNLTFTYGNDVVMGYTKSKTLAEKEVLSYNEIENGKLEVVTLPCGQVGGDTLLSYLPLSVQVLLSQLSGNLSCYNGLRFMQELLGFVPMVHIDDVCEAHIFCMEKASMKGRFLCAAANPTTREIADYYQENYPELKLPEEFMGGPERGSRCDSAKLMNMGFEYKYNMKKIVDDNVECGRRLGALYLK